MRAPRLVASAALAAVASLGGPTAVHATTPALIWRDVDRIGVQCVVAVKATQADHRLEAELCERVRRLAAVGAPAPVAVISPGDPAILAPATATILVHASLQSAGRNRLLVFSLRPFRASAEQNAVLFGAAPRAVPIGTTLSRAAGLDAALGETLAQLLPWQAQQPGPARIR